MQIPIQNTGMPAQGVIASVPFEHPIALRELTIIKKRQNRIEMLIYQICDFVPTIKNEIVNFASIRYIMDILRMQDVEQKFQDQNFFENFEFTIN